MMKRSFAILILLAVAGCATPMPRPVVLDVDRSGQVSLGGTALSETRLTSVLKQDFESQGACPVVICGEPDATHRSIRKVMDLCMLIGHWDLILSGPEATHDELQPWLSRDPLNKRRQFQLRDPPEIREGVEPAPAPGFHVLVTQQGLISDRQRIPKEDLMRQFTALSNSGSAEATDIFITCLADSKHGDVIWLLETCRALNLEHVWLTSM